MVIRADVSRFLESGADFIVVINTDRQYNTSAMWLIGRLNNCIVNATDSTLWNTVHTNKRIDESFRFCRWLMGELVITWLVRRVLATGNSDNVFQLLVNCRELNDRTPFSQK